jgi:hypothetical protein
MSASPTRYDAYTRVSEAVSIYTWRVKGVDIHVARTSWNTQEGGKEGRILLAKK